ncbi:bifunctional 4-hydroxy-2-oxoglutarate aldolase/2-dehydro-3-deoxy-phosphogluconate aldolase [Breznakiella homolactica]|uniref:Bifunctional 4-hydroxy-2-oxoglutarate aldolase/2-dehydro-3-deoxy-phosphogluconate aldolase n=1 Tax=Breznakiella homolactica TaxID=2798577 RepID=A0A7T8BA44_9SPIR|nr:bifunctional 4-hydroxy-2-oxoglutarate aldolase/2-dehydro-3-deoxy-phosphogluconate aldolase [Breznakiella homolactica]QQO08615.1 bifunctional 4-hydroxy-2-oxoglutarate aldolase/2-dehydro-3-deoxy-phosphogluconate aldolase [Breznakiella homolactica]
MAGPDTEKVFPRKIRDAIEAAGIVAVLVIDDASQAVSAAKALIDGGVTAMELALRTPASLEALKSITWEVPGMLAGVGTVIEEGQVREAKDSGAAFIVTPGTNRRIIEKAVSEGMPIAPGIAVPSDIETALECGCRTMKLFPAENLGGIPYLQAINAPYAHLGVRYIPLGGVSEKNLAAYAENPLILGIGGSWIAPRTLIQEKNWSRITANAKEAIRICREART